MNGRPDFAAEYDCDVLVAGSGSAGMAATLRAAELEARVICLEKLGENALGGSSSMCAGIAAVGSRIQREAGETFTVEEVFADSIGFHKNLCNAPLVHKILSNSAEVIDWLGSHGVAFFDWVGGEKYNTAVFYYTDDTSHGFMGVGTGIRQLYAEAVNLGAQFFFKTPLRELCFKGDRICGCIASTSEGLIKIHAPVVMLATGGFANSRQMFEDYTGIDFDAIIPFGCSGRDGDGISLGIAAGAATHHLEAMNFANPTLPREGEGSYLNNVGVNQPSCLWVNQLGQRFVNEECIFDWTLNGNSIGQQSAFFSIIDQAMVDDYRDNGPINGVRLLIDENRPVPDIQEKLDKKLSSGNPVCFRADTLEELADCLALDRQTLVRTVTEYNAHVQSGIDPLGKHPRYLKEITEPPFYGFAPKLAIFNTIGGLKVDEFARVLTKEAFEPIRGLYALGCDGGGMFGSNYDMTVAAGAMQAWCTGGGKIAAEHAVKEYLSAK